MNSQQMKKWLEQQGATFQSGKGSHLKIFLNGRQSALRMHGTTELGKGLETALSFYVDARKPLPVYRAMTEQGIRKAELARSRVLISKCVWCRILVVSELQMLYHQDTKLTKKHKENRTLTLCFLVSLVSWW